MGTVSPVDEWMNPSTDDELLARALGAHARTGDDEKTYQRAIEMLMRRGTDAIRHSSLELLDDPRPEARAVGADVLCQLDDLAGRPADRATVDALIRRAGIETDDLVLESVVSSLGGMRTDRAAPVLISLAEHPSARVRLEVVRSLTWVATTLDDDHRLAEDDPTITALFRLADDPDSTVRDWATFGIGTLIGIDGSRTREVLWHRLDDADAASDTRAEALVGLARRRAPGVLHRVQQALEADSVGTLAVQAAEFLADPTLLPALKELADWWDVDDALLAAATLACDPARQASEVEAIAEFVVAAHQREPDVVISVVSDLLPLEPDGPYIAYLRPVDVGPMARDFRSLMDTTDSPTAAAAMIP